MRHKPAGRKPNLKELFGKFSAYFSILTSTYKSVPVGYFCIFKEIADMVIHLGQNGLHIGSDFVPDISVGSIWSRHWSDNKLNASYGIRLQFDHNYPEYFPQAKSNPQPSWCYPEAALGEFRRWFREEYIGKGKFSKYLMNAVKKKELPPSFAQLAIAAYAPESTQQQNTRPFLPHRLP